MREAGAGDVAMRGVGMVDRREQAALGFGGREIDRLPCPRACRICERNPVADCRQRQLIRRGDAVQPHCSLVFEERGDAPSTGRVAKLHEPERHNLWILFRFG